MTDDVIPPSPTPPAKEVFSKEYVHELREEAKGWRIKHDEALKSVDTAKEAADKRIAEIQAKADDTLTKAQAKAVAADIKVAAKDAKANDVGDILKFLDMSKVKTNDDGEVTNAAELIEALKKAKPYLFGDAKTSSTDTAPKPGDPKPFNALTASKDELAAHRASLVRITN